MKAGLKEFSQHILKYYSGNHSSSIASISESSLEDSVTQAIICQEIGVDLKCTAKIVIGQKAFFMKNITDSDHSCVIPVAIIDRKTFDFNKPVIPQDFI